MSLAQRNFVLYWHEYTKIRHREWGKTPSDSPTPKSQAWMPNFFFTLLGTLGNTSNFGKKEEEGSLWFGKKTIPP